MFQLFPIYALIFPIQRARPHSQNTEKEHCTVNIRSGGLSKVGDFLFLFNFNVSLFCSRLCTFYEMKQL